MPTQQLSIGELADSGGVTRRAVRFYVQRGLLDPPEGRGRASRYTPDHLERLHRIRDLQEAGHSLEAIRRILVGDAGVEPAVEGAAKRKRGRSSPSDGRASLSATLWTKIRVAEGVELHVDLSRHQLEAEQLLRIREAVLAGLSPG